MESTVAAAVHAAPQKLTSSLNCSLKYTVAAAGTAPATTDNTARLENFMVFVDLPVVCLLRNSKNDWSRKTFLAIIALVATQRISLGRGIWAAPAHAIFLERARGHL